MASSYQSPDNLEYRFYPLACEQYSGRIQFRIKATNDAHIVLTRQPHESHPMFEIFIGGWGNKKSVIRKNQSKPEAAEMETPDILSNVEHTGFCIQWNDYRLTVSKERCDDPFLVCEDPELSDFRFFGICTGWGATGDWVIERTCIARERYSPTDPSAPIEMPGRSYWVDASGSTIPPEAYEGGSDGERLFVGRATHEGALIPGKVKLTHGVCYVAWGGEEHAKQEYQVLCGCLNGQWLSDENGDIPPNAIPGGQTEDGEILYIGRVSHEGTLTLGKVQPSHSTCYIPYGGAEISCPKYEILVEHDD